MEFIRPYRTGNTLNQVEQWKLARNPLDVAEAVRERYSVEGADSIATVEGELERLKCCLLYTSRCV